MVGALWVGLMLAAVGNPAPVAPPSPPAPGLFVAVMQPPDTDHVLVEAASRIRSELAASGLEGRRVDCSQRVAGDPPCPDPATREMISLAREDGVVEINVRVISADGLELARRVRVISRDGGDDASVLAVRAVEILRDVRLNARRPPPVGPQPPARDGEEPKVPLPPAPPPDPPRWLLTTGVAMLAAPGGNEPGVNPAAGLAFGAGAIFGPHVLVIANFAGPFNNALGPPYSALGTSYPGTTEAALLQLLATLELRYRLPLGPVEPFGAPAHRCRLHARHDRRRADHLRLCPALRRRRWRLARFPGAVHLQRRSRYLHHPARQAGLREQKRRGPRGGAVDLVTVGVGLLLR